MAQFDSDGSLLIKPIAYIHTDFPTKFGVPRQGGLAASCRGTVVFEPEYRDANALRGLDGFSRLWLIWGFSEAGRDGWSPTVRPPRLGGNTRLGVFATRSPFRPNPLALSCVEFAGTEQTANGTVLHVLGADIMDGTPIYDIKPYLPYADAYPDAAGGFAHEFEKRTLRVTVPDTLAAGIDGALLPSLTEVLAQDPRPAYQNDEKRVYVLPYGGYEISFSVSGDELTVSDIRRT